MFRSIRQGFPFDLALYVMVIEALEYFNSRVNTGHIHWIPLLETDFGQLVNGNFVDDSFSTILEYHQS
jgi:hypothetical protein